jgi:hypothetical protein
LIILERLALEFEPGVRYPEREVNRILRPFHDDHVTLRRYLVERRVPVPGAGRVLALGPGASSSEPAAG